MSTTTAASSTSKEPRRPPPPLPPTPPSKGRIRSLNKCYLKAKSSLSQGIKNLKSGNNSKQESSSNTGTGESSCSDTDESSSNLNINLGNPSSSSSHVPNHQVLPTIGESTTTGENGNPNMPNITFTAEMEAQAYYVNVSFSPTPRNNNNEEEEEDDDSSQWTVSASAPSMSNSSESNNKQEEHDEISQKTGQDQNLNQCQDPPLEEDNVLSGTLKLGCSAATLNSPTPSVPVPVPSSSTIHQEREDLHNLIDPPPAPTIPSFPSSQSSDDSFMSCVSNPEDLLALITQQDLNQKPLKSDLWSPKRVGKFIQKEDTNEDEDEEEEDKTDAGLIDGILDGSEDDLVHSSEGLGCLEERPETGPGEEQHYLNRNMMLRMPQSPDINDGGVHAIINLPPRVMEVVKERRRRSSSDQAHERSFRLSKLMQNDLKTLLDPDGTKGKQMKVPPNVGRVRCWIGRSRSATRPSKGTKTSEDSGDEDSLGTGGGGGSSLMVGGDKSGSEFEDLRRLVKSGGDFCKDLSTILHERSELESQYAKGLSKLSAKLLKASKEAKGSVANAWQAVAVQIDTQAELHRQWATSLEDELAKTLRTSTDTQHKIRKSVEGLVDKTTRNLADWRLAEAKAKRHCFSCSKEFEKLLGGSETSPTSPTGSTTLSNNNRSSLGEINKPRGRILSGSTGGSSDKDPIKLESKRRKAEEAVRRADVDYYTFCLRSERARLEWEGAIRNGSTCLRTLEEEKLTLLKDLAEKYLHLLTEFGPRWMGSVEGLQEPIKSCNVQGDLRSIVDIRRHVGAEQLLPDFYAEETSNLMNRNRRKETLQKCMYLLNQDLEREKKGAVGLESLAKTVAESPLADNANHDITDKLYYLRSMLLYLEAARCKISNALADVEGRPRLQHPMVQYMRHQRDKQGLPQTILKVPSWARDDCLALLNSACSNLDWNDRGKADGTSAHQEEPDFDETEDPPDPHDDDHQKNNRLDEHEEAPPVYAKILTPPGPSIGRCRAIYDYEANLFDELTIRTGDEINIHDKQDDGWWLGELNGNVGIFPATYVEEMNNKNN